MISIIFSPSTKLFPQNFFIEILKLSLVVSLWNFFVFSLSVFSRFSLTTHYTFEIALGKLWRREWQPTPVFLPGKSHEQRTLVGYSPWGCKELDITEQLTHIRKFHLPPLLFLKISIQQNSPEIH